MQLATLIIATTSLVVSTTTLVVILVGAKRAQTMVADTVQTVEGRINSFKQAVADL